VLSILLTAEDATRTVREAGLRLTPQRRAVIDALVGDASHPLAEDVAARIAHRVPGVSLSTVYKTLHEFAEIGLVRELDLARPMRFDADPARHAHFACTNCGSISDVSLPTETLESLARATGVPVDEIGVTVHAPCSTCANVKAR